MRNEKVQRAVDLLIQLIDRLANGENLGKPTPISVKDFFDNTLNRMVAVSASHALFLRPTQLLIPNGISARYQLAFAVSMGTRD